ncbi:MAG: hypothetical protein U5L72_10415 [Bacteroidales bacterium]|nr:hypothetical protein [Bacteroidales bacterium]
MEDMLLNVSMIVDTSTQSDSPETSGNKERTLAEIALQYVWEGKIMNRQNKEAFAKELTAEGVISLKNGDKFI